MRSREVLIQKFGQPMSDIALQKGLSSQWRWCSAPVDLHDTHRSAGTSTITATVFTDWTITIGVMVAPAPKIAMKACRGDAARPSMQLGENQIRLCAGIDPTRPLRCSQVRPQERPQS
jgi:hypothetical protein